MKDGNFKNIEIELHPVNVLFNRVAIEFAIMYPQAAPIGDLKKALQQIVAKFASAAGRMILKDKKLIILCHDQGIPLSYEKQDKGSPDFNNPVPKDCFDSIQNWEPKDETPAQASFTIKVTDFNDGKQVIGVSCSHAIADAKSCGQFLTAWSMSYKGEASKVVVSLDASKMPDVPQMGQPPITSLKVTPEAWAMTAQPFAGPADFEKYDPWVTTYFRTNEDIKNLKEKYKTPDVSFFSTNDVICGDVAELLNLNSFMIIMEFRSALGMDDLFGCCTTFSNIKAPTPGEVPKILRQNLPELQGKEYFTWKCGQGMNK